MYGIYAYIGVVWGVNVGIYGSPMERLETVAQKNHKYIYQDPPVGVSNGLLHTT